MSSEMVAVTPADVIQRDREAAATLAVTLPESFGGNDVAAIRNGVWDDGDLGSIVLDFARYRLLSEEIARVSAAKGEGRD